MGSISALVEFAVGWGGRFLLRRKTVQDWIRQNQTQRSQVKKVLINGLEFTQRGISTLFFLEGDWLLPRLRTLSSEK